MWKDFAFSLRTLRRSPVFTTAAILSLALGIGANTAIYSLLDQVVLRSLPVREPDRMVVVHSETRRRGTSMSDSPETVFSYSTYRALRDRDPAFAGLIARSSSGATLSYSGNAEPVTAELVSGNFFQVLGIPAAAGRVLRADDDGAPGAHPVVVLNHAYWSSRFGRAASILNETVLVNGNPMVVIGVAAPGFHGVLTGSSPDLWTPIAMQRAIRPTVDMLGDLRFYWLNVLGRLQPGFNLARAQAATDVAYRPVLEDELARLPQLRSERDREEFRRQKLELRLASQGINSLRRQWEKPLTALMAMVGLVLLIACANVAGLMLARAAGRQREVAIRLALGAGRRDLMKQLLPEGVLLALAGGALGLLLAVWSASVLLRILPSDYAGGWLTSTLDWRVLRFSATVSLAAAVVFGLLPGLQAARADLASVMKDQASNVAAGGARFRRLLVIAEVALSLILMVGAGLFASSLANLMKIDLGFQTRRLLMFDVNAVMTRPALANAVAFYRDLEQRLAGLGGVAGAAAADAGPFSNTGWGNNLTIEGYTPKGDEEAGSSVVAIGPSYFHNLRIPIRAGREFTEQDFSGTAKPVIANEAFAKKYFGASSPLGRRLMFGGSNHPVFDREIVGVVADVHEDVRQPQRETLYYPYSQWTRPARLTYYVRSSGSEVALTADIRKLLRSLDASIPAANLQPVQVRIDESVYADRLIAALSTAFGALATLLAAIGLYGVVSYAVARRTSEIGVRMALGALPGDVLRMVLLDAGRMAGAGIALGLAGAWALTRLVASQLYGIQPLDAAIYLGSAAALALVAAAAALAPGWRASRIDPVRALKYE